jgi:uncharacterized membrane protein
MKTKLIFFSNIIFLFLIVKFPMKTKLVLFLDIIF